MEDMYRHLRVIHFVFNVGTEQTTWNSMPEDRDIRLTQTEGGVFANVSIFLPRRFI